MFLHVCLLPKQTKANKSFCVVLVVYNMAEANEDTINAPLYPLAKNQI